jgi:hypothetical protein
VPALWRYVHIIRHGILNIQDALQGDVIILAFSLGMPRLKQRNLEVAKSLKYEKGKKK